MGDFVQPEFVLVGADDRESKQVVALREFYASIHDRPVFVTDIRTAELTKVAYNVAIGSKIVMANALMEICHHTGADADDVADALALATDRIVSPRYMRGGMGDGGACHPRDLIALSWLSERIGLSHNLFEDLMSARDDQSRFLARVAASHADEAALPIVILGKAYKAETNLTFGSAALLLATHLEEIGHRPMRTADPYVDGVDAFRAAVLEPAVFVVATRHPEIADASFPPGSVVVDPWRFIADRKGVTVVRLGEGIEKRRRAAWTG